VTFFHGAMASSLCHWSSLMSLKGALFSRNKTAKCGGQRGVGGGAGADAWGGRKGSGLRTMAAPHCDWFGELVCASVCIISNFPFFVPFSDSAPLSSRSTLCCTLTGGDYEGET